MSWPLTVSVEWLASLPGAMCWSVMKPSISTSGVPLIVAMRITRTSGIGEPPLIRKSVWSGELLLSVNDNSKTLGVAGPEFEVTLTLVSASRITWGTGTATTGPIIKVRWIPLSTSNRSWNSFGQSNVDCTAHNLELFGNHDAVGVAQAPELRGVAEETRGDVVKSGSLHDDVTLQQGEVSWVGQHAATEIGDRFASRSDQGVCADTVVAARRRKCACSWSAEIDRLLDWVAAVAHGICSIPSPLSEPAGLLDRKDSFCCK